MTATKWFDRVFDFSFGMEQYIPLRERLQRAPGIYTDTVAGVAEDTLQLKPGNKWSVKEHIGHLLLLEPLWQQRFGEIKAGQPELSPADLNNTATDQASFNGAPLRELTEAFLSERGRTIVLLDSLQAADHAFASIHPRLRQPMRIIDLMYFVAEHDNHHLTAVQTILKHPILRTFGGTKNNSLP